MLPQPSEPFEWTQTAAGQALVCRPLQPYAHHFYTTRAWTLGVPTSSPPSAAWDEVASAACVSPRRLRRVKQVHGAQFIVVREGDDQPANTDLVAADILISSDPTSALAIQAADCVPLLVVDRRGGLVAAAHAGWRGLALGVPAVAIKALEREFDIRPADLLAAIGPSIGACCYEVGNDVRCRFSDAGFSTPQLDRWFTAAARPSARNRSLGSLTSRSAISSVSSGDRSDHWFFDGWMAVRDQLAAAGIPESQVYVAELCTASHPETFCSYRRDGAAAGRLAAAIRTA